MGAWCISSSFPGWTTGCPAMPGAQQPLDGWMDDDPLKLCLKGQSLTPPAWWRKEVFLIHVRGSCKPPAPCQPGSDAIDHHLSGTHGAAVTRAPALFAKQPLKNLESTRFSVQRGQSLSSLGGVSASMGSQRCSEQ